MDANIILGVLVFVCGIIFIVGMYDYIENRDS